MKCVVVLVVHDHSLCQPGAQRIRTNEIEDKKGLLLVSVLLVFFLLGGVVVLVAAGSTEANEIRQAACLSCGLRGNWMEVVFDCPISVLSKG